VGGVREFGGLDVLEHFNTFRSGCLLKACKICSRENCEGLREYRTSQAAVSFKKLHSYQTTSSL
jgi:hypothetical protein